VDATTGQVLWDDDASRMQPPASTTKLLTSAAALQVLGPTFRFETTTRRAGHILYLVGGGDPTLLRTASSVADPAYPRPASLAALAAQTAAALHGAGAVRLRIDDSEYSGPATAAGWQPDYVSEGDITPPSALEVDEGRLQPADLDSPRTTDPAGQAGADFAALLRRDGVRLRGAVLARRTPPSAVQVAAVASPPLAMLVQRMLTVSDNDLAEALGRAVARHDGQPATFADAAASVTSAVRALGVQPSLVSLHDTSGLSHLDRVAPEVLVAVLRAAISPAHRRLRSIIEGLPVAGFTGTLADRYRDRPSAAGAGVVRAKTGTLTGVNTLAGLVVDRSGRLLVFALLASNAPSPDVTMDGLDRLASRLAGCGCR
jgi:D-alanyl-D-alanine carboxypeptidase/D-alanyl-D-alanine-endopeptidase (penicillin-binding protein 4)